MHKGWEGMPSRETRGVTLGRGRNTYVLTQDRAHTGRDETSWMGNEDARGGDEIF